MPSRVERCASYVRYDYASARRQNNNEFLQYQRAQRKGGGGGRAVYGPGLLHEGVARAPYPLFAQRLRERVRVDERAARRVDEHGVLLHLAQEVGVDDVG